MSSIAPSAVRLQTSPQSVPSIPSWFGEVALIAHHLTAHGLLEAVAQQVRFARRRFGHYETIDFVAILIGYALSGEATLETFYDRLSPIIADLDQIGLGYVTRGRDYDLLDLPQMQARLVAQPDQETTHAESGICRTLFDCPHVLLTPTGLRTRLIVATHPATSINAPVGTTRDGRVSELFYTALPPGAFAPSDVLALYFHRGAFETVLFDEDTEQDPDRWCSHTACGQEFWQILSPWVAELATGIGASSPSHSHAHHRMCSCPTAASSTADFR